MRNPKYRSDRYFDCINEDVVYSMFRRGLKEFAGTTSTREAWGKILPNYKREDKITVKVNLNNASYNELITTNRFTNSVP